MGKYLFETVCERERESKGELKLKQDVCQRTEPPMQIFVSKSRASLGEK